MACRMITWHVERSWSIPSYSNAARHCRFETPTSAVLANERIFCPPVACRRAGSTLLMCGCSCEIVCVHDPTLATDCQRIDLDVQNTPRSCSHTSVLTSVLPVLSQLAAVSGGY
jgi:hypothetical protein